MVPATPVLLVDDEPVFLDTVRLVLASAGIDNTLCCTDSRQVAALVREHNVAVTLLDMMMPHRSGLEVLAELNVEVPELPVIIVTAVDDVDRAVEAIRGGAFDYLVKPVDEARLTTAVLRAIRVRSVQDENAALKRYLATGRLERPEQFAAIVTAHPTMLSIFSYVEAVARTAQPVLVTGETGVGKELVARAIHALSGRPGELVTVNVAGVDEPLLADALFGHRRGAFTGADADRQGLVERARDGTLVLDEIGDLSAVAQVKLLRLLQDGSYYPVGADVARRSSARVVAATNRPLELLRSAGGLRPDLFFRLATHHVHLPPLRQRKSDLPLLVEHFVARAAAALGVRPPRVPEELLTLLGCYDFPGNVRELEGLMFDAVSHQRGGSLSMRRMAEKLGLEGRGEPEGDKRRAGLLELGETLPTLEQAEELLIAEALRRAGDNQTIAARLLGLSRQALNNRLRRRQR